MQLKKESPTLHQIMSHLTPIKLAPRVMEEMVMAKKTGPIEKKSHKINLKQMGMI